MSDTTTESLDDRKPVVREHGTASQAESTHDGDQGSTASRRLDIGTGALRDALAALHAVPGPLADHLRPAHTRALLAALDALPD